MQIEGFAGIAPEEKEDNIEGTAYHSAAPYCFGREKIKSERMTLHPFALFLLSDWNLSEVLVLSIAVHYLLPPRFFMS